MRLLLLAIGLTASCSGASSDSPTAANRTNASSSPLVSRGLHVEATSGNASALSDSDYNTVYRSKGVPARLCWDLSPLPLSRRSRMLFAWFNDNYGYDHALFGSPGYNNLGAYEIEASTASGGGAAPRNGFDTLVAVSANTRHSRQHVLNTAGYNWLCLHATQSDGSPRNTDISLQVDLFDVAEDQTLPGILFVGDSITAAAMNHNGSPALSDQIVAAGGRPIPYENAGWPFATSGDLHKQLPKWLADFPGHYVALQIGTNDKDAKPEEFRSNLLRVIADIDSAGKVAVLATVPYATDKDHAPYMPRLNEVIASVLRQAPSVLAGPDFYAEFKAHPELVGPDGVHDTAAGSAHRRALWARWFAVRPDIRSAR